MDIAKQTEQEIKTMRKMIALYCRGNHLLEDGSKRPMGSLCPNCSHLLDYALERIEKCPLKESKDFCSNCPVHCYRPEMREQIRSAMRYSGPRMLIHDPVMAIKHLISVHRQSAPEKVDND